MTKVGPKPIDRILRNSDGQTVDEVVVHDCIVHLEQMSDEAYWIGVYKGDGVSRALAINLWVDDKGHLKCSVEDESDAPGWRWDQDKTHA